MSTIRPATATDQQHLEVFLTGYLGEAGQSLLAAHQINPRFLPGMIQIVEQQGGLAACALVQPIRIQIGVAILECARLTIVPAKLPADLLEALVAACFPALADSGTTLLLTHGSIQDMAPMGFATYRYHTRILLPTLPVGGLQRLRPATSEEAADIAALYDATYRTLPYAEIRTPADWRSWPLHSSIDVYADRFGRVIGYLLIDDDWAVEAGAADAGAARMLLTATRANRLIGLDLPVTHPITPVALQLGAELSMRIAQPDQLVPLAGILDLSGILTQLLPEFERRLADSRYHGWSGTVRIMLEQEQAALQFHNGAAVVLDSLDAGDVWLRRVALGGLAQLLLGYRSAADLRATGDLECEDTALGLLDALFPLIG